MIIGARAKTKYPPIPTGTYTAICVGTYDLGEQANTWKGKTRYRNEVLFTFEFPEETIEIDGEQKPRQLSRRFAVSSSANSNLRKFVTSWMGKAFSDDEWARFNTDSVLGRSALIQVAHNETGEYANIDGIMSLPKGMPQPTTESELHKFNLDEWDAEEFAALPEWIQEKIRQSTQYQKSHLPEDEVSVEAAEAAAAAAAEEEEVPF